MAQMAAFDIERQLERICEESLSDVLRARSSQSGVWLSDQDHDGDLIVTDGTTSYLVQVEVIVLKVGA